MLTFPFVFDSGCSSHYANSTIIYRGVFMGLTQVMLQVKGCEMVCKQRELIPRPGATVTDSKQRAARSAGPAHSRPARPIASNGVSRPVKRHQKGAQTQSETPAAYKNQHRSQSIEFAFSHTHTNTHTHQAPQPITCTPCFSSLPHCAEAHQSPHSPTCWG